MYGIELLLVMIGATLGGTLLGCLVAFFQGADSLIDRRTWQLMDCSGLVVILYCKPSTPRYTNAFRSTVCIKLGL